MYYPQINLCISPGWNKTYIEKYLSLSRDVIEKARLLGMNKAELIAEFVRYASSYYLSNTYEVPEEIWNLMTEIYDSNFKGEVHFSDFVVDAAFRGKLIFEKCEYNGIKFPCGHMPCVYHVPSCYVMRVIRKSILAQYLR